MPDINNTATKWDKKYLNTDKNITVKPAWVLQHHSQHLPLKGKALDLACGLGGNARFLAMCGLNVDAWDISDIALTNLNNFAAVNRLSINPTICDIEQMLFPYQQYDVITLSNYLNRNLFEQITMALKPNGKLFVQTFLLPVQNNAPKNASYYLQTGEISNLLPSLTTEVYGEGWLSTSTTENTKQNRYAWYIGSKY